MEKDEWFAVEGYLKCGNKAYWGAYNSKETAEEVARRVKGKVIPWPADKVQKSN